MSSLKLVVTPVEVFHGGLLLALQTSLKIPSFVRKPPAEKRGTTT